MENKTKKALEIVEKWLHDNFEKDEIVAIRFSESALIIHKAPNQNPTQPVTD